jgi:hypothetical protein
MKWTLTHPKLGDEVGPFQLTRPEVNGICLMLEMEVEKLPERRHQRLIVCYLHLHKTRMDWRKNRRKGGYAFYYEGYGPSKNRDLSR